MTPPLIPRVGYQPLRYHRPKRLRQHRAASRARRGSDALTSRGSITRVNRCEHQMPSRRERQAHLEMRGRAALAQQHDVGIRAQRRRQGGLLTLYGHMALADQRPARRVAVLDRILDGEHMGFADLVDLADNARQSGRLARSRAAGGDDETVLESDEAVNLSRKAQLAESRRVRDDAPERQPQPVLGFETGRPPAQPQQFDGLRGVRAAAPQCHSLDDLLPAHRRRSRHRSERAATANPRRLTLSDMHVRGAQLVSMPERLQDRSFAKRPRHVLA